jgi:hypothetical protein
MSNQTKSKRVVKAVQVAASKTQALTPRAPRPFAIRTNMRAGLQCDYKTCYNACMAKFHDDYNCQFYCDEECQ